MFIVSKTFTIQKKQYLLEIRANESTGFSSDYQVFIDRYYQGRIKCKDGNWQALDEFKPSKHHPVIFTDKVIMRLGAIIDQELNNKSPEGLY